MPAHPFKHAHSPKNCSTFGWPPCMQFSFHKCDAHSLPTHHNSNNNNCNSNIARLQGVQPRRELRLLALVRRVPRRAAPHHGARCCVEILTDIHYCIYISLDTRYFESIPIVYCQGAARVLSACCQSTARVLPGPTSLALAECTTRSRHCRLLERGYFDDVATMDKTAIALLVCM